MKIVAVKDIISLQGGNSMHFNLFSNSDEVPCILFSPNSVVQLGVRETRHNENLILRKGLTRLVTVYSMITG